MKHEYDALHETENTRNLLAMKILMEVILQ